MHDIDESKSQTKENLGPAHENDLKSRKKESKKEKSWIKKNAAVVANAAVARSKGWIEKY